MVPVEIDWFLLSRTKDAEEEGAGGLTEVVERDLREWVVKFGRIWMDGLVRMSCFGH